MAARLVRNAPAHEGRREEDCRWLGTWYSASANIMYYDWEAPNAEAIRKCFTLQELEMAPIMEIEEVAYVNPEWLN
ncbi:MAG: hypothetical protein AB1449_05175 [Chloroflexota bacterium]